MDDPELNKKYRRIVWFIFFPTPVIFLLVAYMLKTGGVVPFSSIPWSSQAVLYAALIVVTILVLLFIWLQKRAQSNVNRLAAVLNLTSLVTLVGFFVFLSSSDMAMMFRFCLAAWAMMFLVFP